MEGYNYIFFYSINDRVEWSGKAGGPGKMRNGAILSRGGAEGAEGAHKKNLRNRISEMQQLPLCGG